MAVLWPRFAVRCIGNAPTGQGTEVHGVDEQRQGAVSHGRAPRRHGHAGPYKAKAKNGNDWTRCAGHGMATVKLSKDWTREGVSVLSGAKELLCNN